MSSLGGFSAWGYNVVVLVHSDTRIEKVRVSFGVVYSNSGKETFLGRLRKELTAKYPWATDFIVLRNDGSAI